MPPEDSSPLIDPGAIFDISDPGALDNEDYDIPPEIQGVLEEHGLAKKAFRVMLKHLPEGGGNEGEYVTSWSRKVPSIDHIARNWGPGEYVLSFQWRAKDHDTDKYKNYSEKLVLTVSEKYREIFEDFQFQKKVQRTNQKRTLVQNERLKKELEDNLFPQDASEEKPLKQDIKAQISEISEMASLLGFRQLPSPVAPPALPWDKIIAIASTALPPLLMAWNQSRREATERSEKMLMLMMSMNQQSSTQLIDVLKTQNGPTSGGDMMKELFSTIMGAIDIKEALQGKKESVADRIFGMIENVAPHVMQLAAMSQQQRQESYQYKMAQTFMRNNPDFKEVEGNPQLLDDIVKRTDSLIGWKQTDLLLEAWGKPRPQSCPRLKEQELPPQDAQEVDQDEA